MECNQEATCLTNVEQHKIENVCTTLIQAIQRGLPKEASLIYENCFLAGGAIASIIQNKPVEDYDIFFKNAEAAKQFMQAMVGGSTTTLHMQVHRIRMQFQTKFSQTVIMDDKVNEYDDMRKGIKVQFIHFKTGEPDELIESFDFIHTMNYYDFKNKKLHVNNPVLIRNKRLVLNMHMSRPISALLRMPKFISRGYEIHSWDYSALIIKVLSLDLSNPIEYNKHMRDLYGFDLKDVSVMDMLTNKKPLDEIEYWLNASRRHHWRP